MYEKLNIGEYSRSDYNARPSHVQSTRKRCFGISLRGDIQRGQSSIIVRVLIGERERASLYYSRQLARICLYHRRHI